MHVKHFQEYRGGEVDLPLELHHLVLTEFSPECALTVRSSWEEREGKERDARKELQ